MGAQIAVALCLVHIGRVVTISISSAAFASALPLGSPVEGRPDGDGGYLVTLDRRALDRLKAKRRAGESDVILRLARGDARRVRRNGGFQVSEFGLLFRFMC